MGAKGEYLCYRLGDTTLGRGTLIYDSHEYNTTWPKKLTSLTWIFDFVEEDLNNFHSPEKWIE